jgi:spore maturation protein CgeB
MRVLVVGPSAKDSSEMGCVRGLRALGHQAEICDLRQHMGLPPALRRSPTAARVAEFVLLSTVREPYYFAQRHLLRACEEFGADLLLVIQLTWVLPQTIEELRRRGVRCVGWFPDAFTSFGRGVFLLAPWDALFFQDPFMVDRLRTAFGLPSIHHLPQCCDPEIQRPLPPAPGDEERLGADVATYGTYYPYRARLLEPLLTSGLRLKLWGPRPPVWLHHPVKDHWAGREILGDEKCRAMQVTKIALNTNHYAGIADINKRSFELAAMGAFQLTDDRPALARYFVPGEEVATFAGAADLLDKVRYYLAHPEERARIAHAGQIRAHRDHTFVARLRVIFDILAAGGSAAAST